MEYGVEYDSKKLHGKKYFSELLTGLEEVPPSVRELLRITRSNTEMFENSQKHLLTALSKHPKLRERVERLMTIPSVGVITALTWILEIEDPHRMPSVSKAISYCGLCSRENVSAGKRKRGPISKQRNKHLQTVLVECAKLAPQWNPVLKKIHQKELAHGHANRATLEVARKLVAYLLSVDKNEKNFVLREVA